MLELYHNLLYETMIGSYDSLSPTASQLLVLAQQVMCRLTPYIIRLYFVEERYGRPAWADRVCEGKKKQHKFDAT